jgi:hypothetical protein
MNIEILGRKAIDIIKSTWGLPKSGFVAGGSISNIIWELVSGNKATVNDIDVFILDSIIPTIFDHVGDNYFEYKEKEKVYYYEDYVGRCNIDYRTKNFYIIVNSEKEGIFNRIIYKSNTTNQSIVIKSFDINCTKVGYSIDEDKIYWEPEFEEFLKTGELKICNTTTPSHTTIRIAKKSKELNAKLDEFEFKLMQHCIVSRLDDCIKYRFLDRYANIYQQNIDLLGNFFRLEEETNLEEYIKVKYSKDRKIYSLCTVGVRNDSIFYRDPLCVFNDENLRYIHNSCDFIFYMRNIYPDQNLKKLWSELRYLFPNDIKYTDGEVYIKDIELLSRLSKYAPKCIPHLQGLKLIKQIEIVKKVFEKFKDDPIVAISILEKNQLHEIEEIDDQTALLLELSVRKEIVNDTKGKVKNILNIKEELKEESILDSMDDFFNI